MGLLMMLLAAQAATPQPVMPGWLAGCWQSVEGERWTEECWTSARGGIMLGSGRSGSGDVVHEWEVMQIERIGSDDPAAPRMTFSAAPKAQQRTTFDWVPDAQPGVTFVNRSHDYPQRVRYWREGRELVAEVALADGSKARRWRYSPSR